MSEDQTEKKIITLISRDICVTDFGYDARFYFYSPTIHEPKPQMNKHFFFGELNPGCNPVVFIGYGSLREIRRVDEEVAVIVFRSPAVFEVVGPEFNAPGFYHARGDFEVDIIAKNEEKLSAIVDAVLASSVGFSRKKEGTK